MKKSLIVLLHLGYWLVYCLLLSTFILFLTAGHAPGGPVAHSGFIRLFLSFTVIPSGYGFYAFYLWLFPKYLQRRRFGLLLALAPLVALACGLAGALAFSALNGAHIMFMGGYTSAIEETVTMALLALINGVIALVLRGFVTWFAESRQKDELLARNYEMELALVKAQINPHFLFNTINNIDVLIEKDAAQASAFLNKLSDILRFTLFETRAEQIPLTQELTYIVKYLDLQRIRSANPDYVRYSLEGDPGQAKVAPMLFIPFIENAFTHAEGKQADGTISIRFRVEGSRITFTCENSHAPAAAPRPAHSGLGNALLQKRLALLYPQRHTLEVADAGGRYRVTLVLNT